MSFSTSTSTSDSLELGPLVYRQLLKRQQELPRPNRGIWHIQDLRTMVDELSKISAVCSEYMDHVKEKQVSRALKEMEYAFEWPAFLEQCQIHITSPTSTLLFRAGYRPLVQRTGYVPPRERTPHQFSFDKYRRCHSVDEFVGAIARHLVKIRDGNKTSHKQIDGQLTSLSPILEWTLHKTGQKQRSSEERVELLIYNLAALKETPGVGIFRISDILQFLEKQNKADAIDKQGQEWARNCDEYITVGASFNAGFVRSIPWEDLQAMPIVSATFTRAYTLGLYRQWREEQRPYYNKVERLKVCLQVLQSAKIIGGEEEKDIQRVREIVELILAPGIWFWEILTDATDKEIETGCKKLLDDELILRGLSRVSISS